MIFWSDLGHGENTDYDIKGKYKPVNIHLVFDTSVDSHKSTGNRVNYSFWVPWLVQPVTAGL